MKWILGLIIGFASMPAASALDDIPLPADDPKAVAFYRACSKGDLDEVKNLFGSGAPIDGQVGTLRCSSLTEAAYQKHADVVSFLIDHRANLNVQDAEGSTALLHACSEKDIDNALLLIKAGADVNLASHFGRTPLMYASGSGEDTVVEALIAHRVNLEATGNLGPAMLWATSANQLGIVKLLGQAGANPSALPNDPKSYSALARAAANNNLEMMEYLISLKADVNTGSADGDTPLMAAAAYSRHEALERLIAHGANVDQKNKKGETAFMLACEGMQMESIHSLIAARADINLADAQGETALTRVGDLGETPIVDLLRQAGAQRTDLHIINKGPDGPGVNAARAWALAVGAIYAQKYGGNPRLLGAGQTVNDCRTSLKHDWNVTDKASLLAQMDDMRDHGHHEDYRTTGAQLAQLSDADFDKLATARPDLAPKMKLIRPCYLKWKERTGLGWDLCRAAALTGDGFCARYLTADEAWERLAEIAKIAQANFGSWQELNDNFLDGREIWAGTRDPRIEACAKLLLNPNDPNSPWNKSPWKTDLAAK